MNSLDKKDFYKVSVAVDVVVFTVENNTLNVLLINRNNKPFQGVRALPGGFVLPQETSFSTAKRILSEKAGIKDIFIEQLYTFDDPKRDPRGPVISITYFALAPRSELILHTSESTQEPTLIPISRIGKLAFDHNKIIEYAQKRLQGKLEYTNLALSLLPPKFTFSELQNVYETILRRKFDKRNFRKKISKLEFITPTKEKVRLGRQRPALLYKAATTKTKKFKNNF
jgi:8-oxo-dGTP diphosphatase